MQAKTSPGGGPSQTTIEEVILTFAADELCLPPGQLAAEANLRELPGVESMRLFRVLARIERHFQVHLDDEVVFASSTIRELAAAVRGQLDGARQAESP